MQSSSFISVLGIKSRNIQNLFETQQRMIGAGADPNHTPDIHIDPDAYSVWSDMKSTTGAPSTTHGKIEDGKIIYPDASTVSIQDTQTICPSLSNVSDQEVPELNTDDFVDIQFESNTAPDFDEESSSRDGSDNAYQRKIF